MCFEIYYFIFFNFSEKILKGNIPSGIYPHVKYSPFKCEMFLITSSK